MTIVTNAFEAVEGQGCVRLRTEEGDADVRVVIADDGPGIAEDLQAKLFEFRFERTGERVKVGFGLPAAYSLLKKHEGDISVFSRYGKGATFTITIPQV